MREERRVMEKKGKERSGKEREKRTGASHSELRLHRGD